MQYSVTKTLAAGLLAIGGLALSDNSSVQAAVVLPAKAAAIGAADPMVVQVRRGGGGGRAVSSGGGRSFSGGGRSIGSAGRSFGGGRSVGRSGPSFGGSRAMGRPGQFRAVAPSRSFRGSSSVGRGIAPAYRGSINRRGYQAYGGSGWRAPNHVAYRKWHRRPYYGYVVGGITLGAILAASAYYAYADEPPIDGVCWFWADPSETEGYWDYC